MLQLDNTYMPSCSVTVSFNVSTGGKKLTASSITLKKSVMGYTSQAASNALPAD